MVTRRQEEREQGDEAPQPAQDEGDSANAAALEAAKKYQELAAKRLKVAQRARTRAIKEAKAALADKREADAYVAKLLQQSAENEGDDDGDSSSASFDVESALNTDPNAKKTRTRFDAQFKYETILEYEERKETHAKEGKSYQQTTFCDEKSGGFNQSMLSRWIKAKEQIAQAAASSELGSMKSLRNDDDSGKMKKKKRSRATTKRKRV